MPDSEKILQNFEGTTSLPVNAAAENLSFEVGISKKLTQNTAPSVSFRDCSPHIIIWLVFVADITRALIG